MSISSTQLADLSAVEAQRLIARKQVSPLELLDACIERVETLDHAVNAMIEHDFDRAREDAKAAEARIAQGDIGPLAGLPFAVKDMIDVVGLRTTYGSEAFRDNVATSDDQIVALMRRAGGVPIGKTNNSEWSAGANTRNRVYGATGNPYDPSKSCSGSSGGSAVALALGYAPLATGSDNGGSLRNPAAYCGVVGYRPSHGVVPGNTRPAALLPLPSSGPMARNVADTGLMLSVMAVPDRNDPFTLVQDGRTLWDPKSFANLPRRDLATARIAFTEDFGFAPTENVMRQQFRKVVSALSPFIGQLEGKSPDCSDADDIFGVLRSLLFLGRHAQLLDTKPELVGPNVAANVAEGRSYSAEDVARAMNAQGQYYRRWQAFFETTDFIITPAITISPRAWRELYPAEIDGQPTKNYFHWLALSYATTIVGHPSISIPCGLDANGMPFGLQIVGRRHDDLGVLAIAAEIEAIVAQMPELALPKPDLAALKAAPPISESFGFLTYE